MSKHHTDQRAHRHDRFKAGTRPANQNRRRATFIVAGLVFLAAFAYAVTARQTPSAHWDVVAATPDGEVRFEAAQFDDGQARFFEYVGAAGRQIRFFVLRSGDGVIRAAFDTCDVCYRARKGYRQEGDVMVCNNCGQTFRSVDVNVLQGGCNPVPLERAVGNGLVVLTAAAIESGAAYF